MLSFVSAYCRSKSTMVRMLSRYMFVLAVPLMINVQPAIAAMADIDCFSPGSSEASAVCSDPESLKLYKLTEEAYAKVQSNPVALGIYIDLLHARADCIRQRARRPYKLCIAKREFEAFSAFNKLRLGPPRPKVGHGAAGRAV